MARLVLQNWVRGWLLPYCAAGFIDCHYYGTFTGIKNVILRAASFLAAQRHSDGGTQRAPSHSQELKRKITQGNSMGWN